MRTRRVVMAFFAPTSFYFACRRPRRAAPFVATWLLAQLLMLRLGFWVVPLYLVMLLAHLIDVLQLEVPEPPSLRDCAVIGLCVWLGALAEGMVVRAKVAEAFKIPSGSSIPTLQVGDHVLVDKQARHPQRGDLVVFIYPVDPEKDFVKRVVGVAGDTVELRDDVVFLDGKPVARMPAGPCSYDDHDELRGSWNKVDCDAFEEELGGHHYRVVKNRGESPSNTRATTVPPGKLFVLGDNRDNSSDSRIWGFVPVANVKGTVRVVWWSSGPDGVRWERLNQRVQ